MLFIFIFPPWRLIAFSLDVSESFHGRPAVRTLTTPLLLLIDCSFFFRDSTQHDELALIPEWPELHIAAGDAPPVGNSAGFKHEK